MDISESLKSAENSLRDLFSFILRIEYGDEWCAASGVSEDRLKQWQERKDIDDKKFGYSDPRLIYYSDFYDLKTILRKGWGKGISDVFGKLKETELLLDMLNDFRNPEAHRRDLLPYQKHLAIGISGKIRAQITEYFSKMDTGKGCYARIESVQDSLGNSWSIGERNPIDTKRILRPGDQLQFTVSATDPLDEKLEYALLPMVAPHKFQWQSNGTFDLTIENAHVQEKLWIHIAIRSQREFHPKPSAGMGKVDDLVKFGYEVLPPR